MNPLTADEMACVAKEVTGIDYAPTANKSGNICAYNAHGYVNSFWIPECNATQWQVLVEWLCKQVPLRTTARYIELVDAINNKDTTALQRMVLELRNPQ